MVRLLVLIFLLASSAGLPSSVCAQHLSDASLTQSLEVTATTGDRLHPYYIHTNQKAYVAAFEITPQEGLITLIYPNEIQPDAQVKAGQLYVLDGPRTRKLYTTNRAYPTSGLLNADRRIPGRAGLNFLYVVASETPFEFSPLEGTPKAFRKRLANNSFHIEGMVKHIQEQLVGKNRSDVSTSLIVY